MQLGNVSGLLSLPRTTWEALGQRFHSIGLSAEAVAPFWDVAIETGGPLREPLVKWQLRRKGTLAAHAMRMFMFWDPVSTDEARAALGDGLPLEELIAAGLLRRSEGGIVSPFALTMPCIGGATFIFCDDLAGGSEAVMGPSRATATLARFACPLVRTASALDLGCGPGTLALAVAPMCDRVVATDVSPRAITLARINTWVNGFDNVELRTGDLFSTVEGESFDLIVSQPPFVPQPPDMPKTPFLFGGPRGDELPLRILGEAPKHLAPGGLAFMTVAWPIIEGEPALLPRLRDRIGPSPDLTLLVLHAKPADIVPQCRLYGSLPHAPDFERTRDVIRYLEHFEQHKIRSIVHTYTAVRRTAGDRWGWTTGVSLEQLEDAPASRVSIDLLFEQGDRQAQVGPASLIS